MDNLFWQEKITMKNISWTLRSFLAHKYKLVYSICTWLWIFFFVKCDIEKKSNSCFQNFSIGHIENLLLNYHILSIDFMWLYKKFKLKVQNERRDGQAMGYNHNVCVCSEFLVNKLRYYWLFFVSGWQKFSVERVPLTEGITKGRPINCHRKGRLKS